MCLSAMIQLEIPHINIFTKCDLITDKSFIDKYCDPSLIQVLEEINATNNDSSDNTNISPYARLNASMSQLIEQYSMVSFYPLDLTDEDSIDVLLQHIDHAIQYGEDGEPREPQDEQEVELNEHGHLSLS